MSRTRSRRWIMRALMAWMFVLSGCAGVQVRPVSAPVPSDFPAQGFSHRGFETLLQRFVVGHGVDYAAWHADTQARARLNAYLAAVAAYSPENAPERFPKAADRKAYWLYVYNALVIQAVLDHWPLDSVNDVKAPIELTQGYGFFYHQGFVVGGKTYNLYDLEHNQVLRQGDDPRTHFILNCASASCPPIKPNLPTGDALEPFLAQATRDFLDDPRNLRIDHATRTIRLSRIFQWYQAEFLNDLRRRARPAQEGIVDYLRDAGSARVQTELRQAHDYHIEYLEYDWALNLNRAEHP